FNPKPRLVFALSLSLGVVGGEEIAELDLNEAIAPEEIHRRLAAQTPAGLDLLAVERIDVRQSARVRQATYRIALPAERPADLPERITALLSSPHCWIERTRPETRRLDLRPYLHNLRLLPDALEMELYVTPKGTARPEEVLAQLGLRDLLDAGHVLER